MFIWLERDRGEWRKAQGRTVGVLRGGQVVRFDQTLVFIRYVIFKRKRKKRWNYRGPLRKRNHFGEFHKNKTMHEPYVPHELSVVSHVSLIHFVT